MKEIYIVRHGATYFNKYHHLQGWSDTPLLEEKKYELILLGKKLSTVPFELAVSSDLKRAIDSLELILKQFEESPKIEIRSDFREQFFGSLEGLNGQKIIQKVSGDPNIVSFKQWIDSGASIDQIRKKLKIADDFHECEDTIDLDVRVNRAFRWLTD